MGTATGKGFHKLGHNIMFFDISKQRLMMLRQEGYSVAFSLKEAISKADISFVCVNTPQNRYNDSNNKNYSNNNDIGNNANDSINHNLYPIDEDLGKHQDLSQLLSALRDIADVLNDNIINKKHLLVFRSTMLPGTMRNVILDYLETNCNLKRGKDYEVLYNPEFLRQYTALDDFFAPDRIVIGQEVPGTSSPLSNLYSPLTQNIILTGYEEAEMAKYASNCFLALKISYFNEIDTLCKRMGINQEQVSLAVSMDNRIGKYGTRGGRPYGGACFPKDTEAFASFTRKMNVKPDLVETAISINKQIDDLNSTELCVRKQLPESRYIKEPEV